MGLCPGAAQRPGRVTVKVTDEYATWFTALIKEDRIHHGRR
jgi:hypothetical protein